MENCIKIHAEGGPYLLAFPAEIDREEVGLLLRSDPEVQSFRDLEQCEVIAVIDPNPATASRVVEAFKRLSKVPKESAKCVALTSVRFFRS